DETGERLELLDELRVEVPAALIGGKEPLAKIRRAERVPGGHHRARPLALVEAEQEIGEADDRPAAQPAGPPERLRQRVIGAMRERIAVDDQQGTPDPS